MCLSLTAFPSRQARSCRRAACWSTDLASATSATLSLRDRKHLGEDGLIVVVTTIDGTSGEIVAGPDIISRGFVYVREAEDMLSEARAIAKQTVQDCVGGRMRDWGNIKTQVRDALSSYFYGRTKRSPMILPVIQEV